MLRYSFLPSDYHPLVLILGEAADMPALSGLLRRFSEAPREFEFSATEGFAPSDTRIAVAFVPETEKCGMYLALPKGKVLRWWLDAPTAERFAWQIDELADHDRRSGSERLLCGDYREIPVRVSRGEFTDDYLIFNRLAEQPAINNDRESRGER